MICRFGALFPIAASFSIEKNSPIATCDYSGLSRSQCHPAILISAAPSVSRGCMSAKALEHRRAIIPLSFFLGDRAVRDRIHFLNLRLFDQDWRFSILLKTRSIFVLQETTRPARQGRE